MRFCIISNNGQCRGLPYSPVQRLERIGLEQCTDFLKKEGKTYRQRFWSVFKLFGYLEILIKNGVKTFIACKKRFKEMNPSLPQFNLGSLFPKSRCNTLLKSEWTISLFSEHLHFPNLFNPTTFFLPEFVTMMTSKWLSPPNFPLHFCFLLWCIPRAARSHTNLCKKSLIC